MLTDAKRVRRDKTSTVGCRLHGIYIDLQLFWLLARHVLFFLVRTLIIIYLKLVSLFQTLSLAAEG